MTEDNTNYERITERRSACDSLILFVEVHDGKQGKQ